MPELSPGQRFRDSLLAEKPLQIAGTINALCAMQAEAAGFRAIYLSGAGVANASYGLPDLGVTSLNDVVTDASRITAACSLPLLVDIDTGWGTDLTIHRAIRELERAGVAAIHMEDQVAAKRCGHRPGKELVEVQEMQARIEASVDARRSPSFVIMARTDALAVEGLESALERAAACIEAGADMFLMPSRYEPCGLNQMYSLRYGTVPIVHRTGGLADTVRPWNPSSGTGTGFPFEHHDEAGLRWAVLAALAAYRDPAQWQTLIQNGMAHDFSWEVQGKLYEWVYQRLGEGN